MHDPKIGDRRWEQAEENDDRLNYEWDGLQWLLIERRAKDGTPIWILHRE